MLLASFDILSMYPNITLDHAIRAVRRKLLDRERVPMHSLKVDIIFPSKVATKGQKMHVIISTLR